MLVGRSHRLLHHSLRKTIRKLHGPSHSMLLQHLRVLRQTVLVHTAFPDVACQQAGIRANQCAVRVLLPHGQRPRCNLCAIHQYMQHLHPSWYGVHPAICRCNQLDLGECSITAYLVAGMVYGSMLQLASTWPLRAFWQPLHCKAQKPGLGFASWIWLAFSAAKGEAMTHGGKLLRLAQALQCKVQPPCSLTRYCLLQSTSSDRCPGLILMGSPHQTCMSYGYSHAQVQPRPSLSNVACGRP